MRNNQSFWVGVATICTLCLVVLSVRFLPEMPNDFGITLCAGDACSVQGWLSALSGYFALLAAGVGVWVTWGSLHQQRKQTDFLLGDAMPEIALIRTCFGTQDASWELVNWNRKSCILRGVSVTMEDRAADFAFPQPVSIQFRRLENKDSEFSTIPLNAKGEADHGVAFAGWKDRQKEPPGWTLLLIFPEDCSIPENFHSEPAIITFRFVIYDEFARPRVRRIVAKAGPVQFVKAIAVAGLPKQ